jgi:hypothetical protein
VFGATPDRTGLIPHWQEEILLAFGEKIKQLYAHPVQQLSGSKRQFTLSFSTPQKLNYVIVQEDLSQGERIRSWKLEGLAGGALRQLAKGQSVGNKRIVLFASGMFEQLHFTVDKDVEMPVIKSIQTGLAEDDMIKDLYKLTL